MGITRSASRGYPVTMQEGATTGNGTAYEIPSSFSQHKVTIQGVGAVGAGAVTIESAPSSEYTGTWSPVTSPVNVPANALVEVNFTGIFQALRARISTTVTVGTLTAKYVGS